MHLAIFLTLVWMQQEDEHGKMDYQHWLVDLEHGKVDCQHWLVDLEHGKMDYQHWLVDLEHGKMDYQHWLVDLEHGKMDYQHWLVDLELPIEFWVDPKLFENKKQEAQVGLCCFLGPDGKCRLNIKDG